MLTTVIKKYPDFGIKLYVLSVPANELFEMPAQGSKGCVGAIYLHGVITPVDAKSWQPIEEHFEWRDRGAWGGWNDPNALPDHNLAYRVGPEDASWLCVWGDVRIEPHAMVDELVVPARTPFIVGSDTTVSFAGKERGAATLFGPRDIDTKAYGNATLLFVKEP